MKKILSALALAALLAVSVTGCSSDADVASYNISKAADMFQIERRIVFYNGINGDYILSIEGRCSIEKDGLDNQLEVTCKVADSAFKKHYLGLSDNVTYFAEQLATVDVSVYRYKVIFKPVSIVPDIEVRL